MATFIASEAGALTFELALRCTEGSSIVSVVGVCESCILMIFFISLDSNFTKSNI